MKTAVLTYGPMRSLRYTYQNLIDNAIRPLGESDLYAFVSDDQNADDIRLLNPFKVQRFREKPIEGKDVLLEHFQFGPNGVRGDKRSYPETWYFQNWLKCMYQIYKVNELRKKSHRHYDAVVRLRSDIWFTQPLPPIDAYDLGKISVPSNEKNRGCNDRFALGPPHLMDVYFNEHNTLYDTKKIIRKGSYLGGSSIFNTEMYLEYHLKQSGIETDLRDDIRFVRCRGKHAGGNLVLR